MNHTRREFVSAIGKGAVAPAAGVTLLSSDPARADEDPLSYKPESVSWEKDMEVLRRFQPRLDLTLIEENPDDAKPVTLHGSIHYSADFENAVAQYWCEYQFQNGWLPTGADSHYGDHEPFLVYFDPDTLEPERVIYSAYHWLAANTQTFIVDDSGSARHPLAMPVSPWHQYTLDVDVPGDDPSAAGTLVGLEYFHPDTYRDWWDHGWNESIHPKVVPNPYKMLWRGTWWDDDGTAGLPTTDLIIVEAARYAHVAGYSKTDTENLV